MSELGPLALVAALCAVLFGCAPSDAANRSAGAGATAGVSTGGSETAADAGSPGAGTSNAGTAGHALGAGGSAGGSGSARPMQLISRNMPAFASSGMAKNANDDQPNIAWSSETLPAWLAYDLSSVPVERRQQALLAQYCYFADYLVAGAKPEQMLPLDYVVETNSAPGGGQPPDTGWTEVVKITANAKGARQHIFDLLGANWLRVSVTKSSDAAKVLLDVDVYSAPSGGSDGWLFMGDSITYMTTQRAFSDLPELVEKTQKGRVPLVVDGALGGTNTTTAQGIIATSLSEFEGRYVVLAYGTNDHAAEYQMESLVQQVIAAGKVPVVPHVPWSDQKLAEGPLLNQNIDALYLKYPEILKGPDLWQAFENRLDLIPPGDVHPNAEGQDFLRTEWMKTISSVDP